MKMDRSEQQHSKVDEAGMSLVEVLIALGVMAGVLISVASLFVLGGQRVKGGQEMTQATAIASDILEELNDLGFRQVPAIFPDCCTDGTCDTETGCTVSSLTDTFAAGWQPSMDDEMYQARAEITITPVGGPTTPSTYASCEGIRLHVEILWSEGTTTRSVEMENVRF